MLHRKCLGRAIPWIACVVLHGTSADASEAAPCGSPVSRSTLVNCALATSMALRAEQRERDAIGGRAIAASPWLPSNPVISVTGTRRFGSAPGLSAYNWSAALGQEIEIAGQRGLRREVVESQRSAQEDVLTATARDAAANAWAAYFELLAARDDLALAARLEALSKRVADAASGAAAKGLDSGVDADVADAAFVRAAAFRANVAARESKASATLASLLGLDPTSNVRADGDLIPLPSADTLADGAPRFDPDTLPAVRVLVEQRRGLQRKAEYFRRARWPNPTVSILAQNDEVDQPVFGVGLAFPLVLPGPIGHTYAGEIVESDALAQKADAQADKTRRDARLELAVAVGNYKAAREGRALYAEARVARADASLRGLADAVTMGRIAVRDAVLSQQGLIDLLRGDVEARLALCLASVELARAAGIPLERGAT